jgi:hypothetical protein
MVMAEMQDWEFAKKHGRVVAKAWADPAFKERLLADPATVLREHGFDGDEAIRFVMPPPPTGEFGDEALDGHTWQAGVGGTAHTTNTTSSGPHTAHTTACNAPAMRPRLHSPER